MDLLMSGVTISGGAIAVDTDDLHRAAGSCALIAGLAERANEQLTAAANLIGQVRYAWQPLSPSGVAGDALATADRARKMSVNLATSAEIYAGVERFAQLRFDPTDIAGALPADQFLSYLQGITGLPAGTTLAAYLIYAKWRTNAVSGLRIDARLGVKIHAGGVAKSLLRIFADKQGLVPINRTPNDPAIVPTVEVALTKPPSEGEAPENLADIADRIPNSGDERIRVEKYVMEDGTETFAVYITGTQGNEVSEPFNMASNFAMRLDTSTNAASYIAVKQALEAAGAKPGDSIIAAGHSQGAMITELLAQDEDYETIGAYSFGAPLQAEMPDGVLHVVVTHTDDPVAALSAVASPVPNGDTGSFVATRETGLAAYTVTMDSHALTEYKKTAEMVDATDDSRVDAMHNQFADLSRAESVTVYEFSAETVTSTE